MKLIHVCGEDDYSVLDFENLKISINDAYDKAFHTDDGVWEFKPNGWVTARNFPNVKVTDDFMSFVRDCLGDEDRMKAENFFIIEK